MTLDEGALGPAAARTATLFGEAPTRVIISVSQADAARIEADAKAANISCTVLGRTTDGPLTLGSWSVTTQEIRDARVKALAFVFG